jgi:ferredoxin
MIVAEQKPFEEIFDAVKEYNKILVLGCGTCVTVCMTGGEKEVGILSKQLRLAAKKENKNLEVLERTITRQCDEEFFDEQTAAKIKEVDAVLSVGCGVGIQHVAYLFPAAVVRSGVNTKFFGANMKQGVWSERCAGCGECVLDKYEGICPIARCSKGLMNGPCGGSADGMCEVDPENIECGWQLIYDRMKKLNKLDKLLENQPPKDWSTHRDGGPRKIVREDMMFD